MDPMIRILMIYKFIHFLYYSTTYYLRHFYSADSFVDTAMNLVGSDYKVLDFDTMTAVVEIVHYEKLAIGFVVD